MNEKTMPQIPLFVSSAKAGTGSTGSFSINFQPPLELPAAAKNATIEVQQMSAPYTSPNISAALDNNQLVIQLPNGARTGFQTMTGSSDPHRSVITIPSGLYSLDALEAEINHQVNLEASTMGVGQFNKRNPTVTEKTVNTDGTDGANIDGDPTPNFLRDVLAFETSNPTKVSVQSFVGTDINRLTFRLVDQHNDPVTDLQGEHFSAVVLFSYDN